MPRKQPQTVGEEIAQDIHDAIREMARAPVEGARDLPVVRGVTSHGSFLQPTENVLAEVGRILADSGRVFIYGSLIVYETRTLSGDGRCLVPLVTGHSVETGAEDRLANIFLCENGEEQFPPPKSLTDLAFRSDPVVEKLPRIDIYARKPVFDSAFNLRGPGWDPESRILIHGPHVEPAPFAPPDVAEALERMPPHLRTLLSGFCFASAADLVHAVAFLLTGLLANHFVSTGKPIALIDGNQPGVGKTLLAILVGILMDGRVPRTVQYTADDDEMAKRLCATLRDSEQSILLVDNAKTQASAAVSSAAIEANCLAPIISLRILGHSANFQRPNDVLWAITMNQTRVSQDLVSRSLAIRLAFEGPTENRRFSGPDPIEYATSHRLDILGELAGMVVRWTEAGRPPGTKSHRLAYWAEIIGGILVVAHLPEFLDISASATSAFSPQLDQLAALAEFVARQTPGEFWRDSSTTDTADGVARASAWEPVFRQARILVDEPGTARAQHGRSVAIGQFLSPLVGRVVPIVVSGKSGSAVLRSIEGRSHSRMYGFVIKWEDTPPDASLSPPPLPKSVSAASRTTHSWPDGTRTDPASSNPSSSGATRGNDESW